MYYSDGFIKKFPLDKPEITLGYNEDNDFSVNNELISGHHLKIIVEDQFIKIIDLDSTNGTYYSGGKVKESIVKVGESFSVGCVEFILKQGDMDEFKTADELIPIFNKIKEENEIKIKKRKTKYIKNIYEEVLKQILKVGIKKESINDLLLEVSNHLSNFSEFGSIFIVSNDKKGCNFHMSIKNRNVSYDDVEKLMEIFPDILDSSIKKGKIPENRDIFYSFPFYLKDTKAVLIYIPERKGSAEQKVLNFLLTLTKEIELFSGMIKERSYLDGNEEVMVRNGSIMGSSKVIKSLIKQTEKIARSNLFILIQGESGTGKELFARLIHDRSNRKKERFVAINCAAIPEQLLEAEFFGYEKGAFTGAYAKKIGKFEVACGGTLILDEIGDMPISLQARLLRALQENEFYRLGGTVPVKVDLRIISLTNKNLMELLESGEFREDLYYRLVHHTIEIPPLRERPEDVPVLINYFAGGFARKAGKNFRGFSVKAQKALLGYNWPGNIRQLKNEVNRIINLTDNKELISFDILSNDIKEFYKNRKNIKRYKKEKRKESETELVIRILEENNWNKTHAAKELGMTYRGLHKKMKRLNITKENSI